MNLLRNPFLLKRLLFVALISVASVSLSAEICPAQEKKKKGPVTYTQKDRDYGVKYFTKVQERFVKSLTGLSDAQLNFQPNEKSWTVGMVAEHLVLTEGALRGMIQNGAMKAPLNADPNICRMSDNVIRMVVTNRTQKFQAPEMVQPKKQITTVEALIAAFKKERAMNIDILKNTQADLRNHFAENPLFGNIDAYQWFMFMNGHTERHLAQIDEIMADGKYPAE